MQPSTVSSAASPTFLSMHVGVVARSMRLCVFGAGMQARFHVVACLEVCPAIQEVLLFAVLGPVKHIY